MDNMELLDIVNSELEKGKSLVAIGKVLNIGESSIRKRLNRLGYRRVDNKFVLVTDDITSNITPKNKTSKKKNKVVVGQAIMDELPPIINLNKDILETKKTDITSNITPIIEVAITSEEKENSDIIGNITPANNDKLQLLLNNIDKLLSLIPDANINTNTELKSNIKQVTTLRLDSGVYGAIKDYSTKRNISVTDVVEKALIDYLNNYL